jgi:protein-S-isoprenylcysteine O-methyltransferase Ste14
MLVVLVGTVILIPNRIVFAMALFTVAGITHQARREEQHLLGVFGERYAQYLTRTGRFFPRLRIS